MPFIQLIKFTGRNKKCVFFKLYKLPQIVFILNIEAKDTGVRQATKLKLRESSAHVHDLAIITAIFIATI